jgi:protein phosphatase PTC7
MAGIGEGLENLHKSLVKGSRAVAVIAVTLFVLDYIRVTAAAQPLARSAAMTMSVGFDVGVAQIPHPDKIDKGGEDTYYMAGDHKSAGVFDGVGGWNDQGVDPRAYSLALSKGAQKATDEHNIVKPSKIMKFAWSSIDTSTAGSSTACIVSIDNRLKLRSSCLGDSGFAVFSLTKDGKQLKQVYRSKEQQHSFNFPFQLGHSSEDTPWDAIEHVMDVKEGDVIVLGSDGLFDNVFDKEILRVLDTSLTGRRDAESLHGAATKLAQTASTNAHSTQPTPFSVSAYEHGILHRGGKVDDITVLVARIRAREVAPPL